MLFTRRRSLVLGLALPLLSHACGKSDDDDKAEAVVRYGDIKTSLLASTDVRTATLTTASCGSNGDTGLFTGVFTGAAGEMLDVKIKDFSTTPRTYTCIQPESNRAGDLGEKYNGCGIEFAIPDANLGANTYSSYRTLEAQDTFTYTGTCTVTTSYTAPKITLDIVCSNLIQTKYHGAARNPISGAETASLTSGTVVECSI
jgi:hypothetical protein